MGDWRTWDGEKSKKGHVEDGRRGVGNKKADGKIESKLDGKSESKLDGKSESERGLIRRSICELLMGVCMLILLAGIHLWTDEQPLLQTASTTLAYEEFKMAGSSGYCVVLDAGHGASDPGKIGCNDAKEKEINLAIVQKLKTFLEAQDVEVVLTRDSDEPLYESSASNKKMSDMHTRVSIIEDAAPDLVVSIHQNSYHESSVYGPQVFYYKASEEGKRAAEILQESFSGLDEIENRRVAKANDNYYLLLHTSVPMVIAECGFLSNPQEADLLIQDAYQEKIAWVLHLGILEYLSGL